MTGLTVRRKRLRINSSSASATAKVRAGFSASRCAYSFSRKAYSSAAFLSAPPRALLLIFPSPVLHRLHIRKDEFQIDGFYIPYGIDGIFHVRDVRILETAHDVHDGVHFADRGEEFVAQSLAAGSALDESCDVHEFDDGGRHFFALIEGGKLVQTLVGHRHDADVRLDGAKRIIGAFRARMGDCVEKSGFSHVGKTYDTEFHDSFFLVRYFKATLFSANAASVFVREHGAGSPRLIFSAIL